MHIGLLHPGEMGASVGAALLVNGMEVGWVNVGRSAATQHRGRPFQAFESLHELTIWADAVISICPPEAAVSQAQMVYATAFDGLYIDANAIAPNTAKEILRIFGAGAYVDGGIIGPPALTPGTTRLYLSGQHSERVASWFSLGMLEAMVIADTGYEDFSVAASALKMAYAAYSKGSIALLLAVNALAESSGISKNLRAEWDISQPSLGKRSERVATGAAHKAWRFAGEMLEISATFKDQGLPGDFHQGAAQLYASFAGLKDQPGADLAQVVEAILANSVK